MNFSYGFPAPSNGGIYPFGRDQGEHRTTSSDSEWRKKYNSLEKELEKSKKATSDLYEKYNDNLREISNLNTELSFSHLEIGILKRDKQNTEQRLLKKDDYIKNLLIFKYDPDKCFIINLPVDVLKIIIKNLDKKSFLNLKGCCSTIYKKILYIDKRKHDDARDDFKRIEPFDIDSLFNES